MLLETFLNKKPLYYDEIDYTRMPRIYAKIKHHFKTPQTIHLIGTNGKGTTGRFLASALYKLGYKVGHYTSPHILEFNERIWLNGADVDNKLLENTHNKLLQLLETQDRDALSYFEYTTLLAMLLYAECDYVVLEAGLGGEHDATAVFPKSLTLVTPIDKDHEAFLGDSIESIATTKLNAVQNYAILAKQSYDKVYEIASLLAREKDKEFYTLDYFIQKRDTEMLYILQEELSLAPYLLENLSLAMAALHFLKIPFKKDIFHNATLFGRLSYVKENILVDVGHNTLAAKRILESLREDKYVLVYNSYKDKNYKEILEILQPIIEDIYIIKVDEERIETRVNMQRTLESLGFSYKDFIGLQNDKKYLIFGSFSVVEAFLKGYIG